MRQTIKFSLITLLVSFGLGMGSAILAQETSTTEDVILDEDVQAQDLEITEPNILPDSPFYFLKEWGRGIQSFFTFGQLKKSALEVKFANERLIELKKLSEEGKNSKILEKATEKYRIALEKINTATDEIKENAAENEEVNKFLDKFTKQQLLHEKILQKLENQVPEEVLKKIEEARETHLKRFGEIMAKLEDKKDKIAERLEKSFEEQEGSKFKNFKNLEVLKNLEEKVPEEAKEAIQKAAENALKRLQGDLEKMSSEDQEKFKDYIDKISGDKEKQLEILENLKLKTEDKTQLRGKINAAKEGILERVQEKAQEKAQEGICPTITKPDSNFCQNGRIVIERNDNGCIINFGCVKGAGFEPESSLEAK